MDEMKTKSNRYLSGRALNRLLCMQIKLSIIYLRAGFNLKHGLGCSKYNICQKESNSLFVCWMYFWLVSS